MPSGDAGDDADAERRERREGSRERETTGRGDRRCAIDRSWSATGYSADALDVLPEEALAHIWAFLDPLTIARASAVCKRFRDLGRDEHIWRAVAAREGLLAADAAPDATPAHSGDGPTRALCVERFMRLRREREEAERKRATAARTARRWRRRARTGRALRVVLFNRPCEWALCALAVAMSVLVPLKLDGHLPALPWGMLLIPLLHAAGTLVAALVVYDAAASAAGYPFDTELSGEHHIGGAVLYFLLFVVPFLGRSKRRVRALHYPLTGAAAALLALVYTRAVAPAALPMPVVVAPLAVALLVLCALVWTVGNGPCGRLLDRLILQGALAAALAFTTLLALRAGGYVAWSWHAVMLPLYAMQAAALAAFLAAVLLRAAVRRRCCVACCRDCCPFRRRLWRLLRTSYLAKAPVSEIVFLGVTLTFCVLGPLLALEVLLAAALDGHTSFAMSFVPVFLLEGVALSVYFVVNVVVCFDLFS